MGFRNEREDMQISRVSSIRHRRQINDSTKESIESGIRTEIVITNGASDNLLCELLFLNDIKILPQLM